MTRRWVGPAGPTLISSLSSAADSRPSSSRVRFWPPCSMRAIGALAGAQPLGELLLGQSAVPAGVADERADAAHRARLGAGGRRSRGSAVTVTARTVSHRRDHLDRGAAAGGPGLPRRGGRRDRSPDSRMDVLVTGGTGRLGRRLAEPLQAAGHQVRLMSRRGTGPGGVRGDLATGRDLHQALAGAQIVVHAASDPRGDYWQTDVAGTRRLVQAVDRDRLRTWSTSRSSGSTAARTATTAPSSPRSRCCSPPACRSPCCGSPSSTTSSTSCSRPRAAGRPAGADGLAGPAGRRGRGRGVLASVARARRAVTSSSTAVRRSSRRPTWRACGPRPGAGGAGRRDAAARPAQRCLP